MPWPQIFLYVMTAAMVAVIVYDLTRYIIPNTLNLFILGLYPFAAYVLGLDWMMALAAAGIVLLVGFGIFALGFMGGGDIKLLVVLTLWVGWGAGALNFFFLTALLGAVLVIAVLLARFLIAPIWARLSPERGLPRILRSKQPVPYGIAIAAAFLVLAHTKQIAAFA